MPPVFRCVGLLQAVLGLHNVFFIGRSVIARPWPSLEYDLMGYDANLEVICSGPAVLTHEHFWGNVPREA